MPKAPRERLTPGAIVVIIALLAATIGAGAWGFTRKTHKVIDSSTPLAPEPADTTPTTVFSPTDAAGRPLFADPAPQAGYHVVRDNDSGFSLLVPDGWLAMSPSDVTVFSSSVWFGGPAIGTLRFKSVSYTKTDAAIAFIINSDAVDGPVPSAVVTSVQQSLFSRAGASTITNETIGGRPAVRIRGRMSSTKYGSIPAQVMMQMSAHLVVGVLVFSNPGGAPTTHDTVASSLRVRR